MNCVWPPTAIWMVVGSFFAEQEAMAGHNRAQNKKNLTNQPLIRFFPPDQTALQRRDAEFDDHYDNTPNQHPRVDARRIKVTLGLTYDPSESLSRCQVFADHRANEGEPDRRVKTRQDPAHCRRQQHMPGELPLRCA